MNIVQRSRLFVFLAISLIGLSVLVSGVPMSAAVGQRGPAYVRLVRAIPTERFGVAHPVGLAFMPSANAFLVAGGQRPAELVQLSPLADMLGVVRLPVALADPLNMGYDSATSRLLTVGPAAVDAIGMVVSPEGRLAPTVHMGSFELQPGARRPGGVAIDAAGGRLFVLDTDGPAIVQVTPGRVSRIELRALGLGDLHGLAFDPRHEHLYTLSRARQALYELGVDGTLVATRDLSRLRTTLIDPQAMTFAPSGDQTDDLAQLSLYVADSRASDPHGRSGHIIELSLDAPLPPMPPASTVQPILIQTIDLSQWPSPSTDPMDITYLPKSRHLLVSDSEIEEPPQLYWHGVNQFEMTLTGSLVAAYTTFTKAPVGIDPRNFTAEPSGVSYNPLNGHWIYSDDVEERVFDVNLGTDGVFGTADDTITWFRAKSCGDYDAESVTIDTKRGHIILADGLDSEAYDIAPGPNGIFDGCAPDGDDLATHFDTASLGILDPEAVEYNADHNSLYISGAEAKLAIETTLSGTLLKVFDLSSLNINNPSGLAYAPSSAYPTIKSLYIAARGKDNDTDPTENDGKVYEIALEPLPQATPTPRFVRSFLPSITK